MEAEQMMKIQLTGWMQLKMSMLMSAIKNIQNGHYQSAIQKIVDLGKIEHYQTKQNC